MKKQITFWVISKLLFTFVDIHDQKHEKTKQQTNFSVKSKPHVSCLHKCKGFCFLMFLIIIIKKQKSSLLITQKLICFFMFKFLLLLISVKKGKLVCFLPKRWFAVSIPASVFKLVYFFPKLGVLFTYRLFQTWRIRMPVTQISCYVMWFAWFAWFAQFAKYPHPSKIIET